ncbi:unnamed protein product [Acanthoscelides obtectus]|uniref:Uncharacterized protein n=1 Tax=Acanthoscelides obtectus TaxID=200917 RepID=A0A9P0PWQ5_ACAOB|nr:unnamed protein product [Acanthoscelides obtectus]CAK1651418.1 General odorant-binding protein 83a [Acanthoscelides obtectus]
MKFKSSVIYFLMSFSMGYCITLPPELQEYVDDLHKICVGKTGISESDHSAYDIQKNPHDPKLMCYMKCLMLEAKWMGADGTIQYDFIIDTAHPQIKDLLVAAISKCRVIDAGADLCEKASNFNMCMYKADPVNWFLI